MGIFGRISFGTGGKPEAACCGKCRYFNDDPRFLEEAFRGVNALSSVHGDSRGDSGICTRHGRYLLPSHTCSDFLKKS